ncbi:MAG: DNA gyrase inhibitor [bacterium]|nr:DNA gyrase inhibitor [bacterium]
MNVTIEELPKYHTAYMRQIGPYGPGNFQLMERLKKWAMTRDLLSGSAIILGIAHDDPEQTLPEHCRYDCCIVIPEDFKLEDTMKVNDLPGGKYAVCGVNHTAGDIGQAWNDLFSAWLPESGFQVDNRPLFERYLNDIECEEITCEICIPVKPL